MKRFWTTFIFLILLLPLGCQSSNDYTGGAEAGNPGFRDVTGELNTGANASLSNAFTLLRRALAAGTCPADTLIATDSEGNSTLADIDSADCSFSVTLATGKSYSLSFTQDDEFVATLIFQASDTLESTVFHLTDDDNAVDLGVITIAGGLADCDSNPYEQNDQDDDGENDFEDTDDDNDDIDDEEDYVDCNNDGYYEDDSACEIEDGGDNTEDGGSSGEGSDDGA